MDKSKQPTWRDLGYNSHMQSQEVAKENEIAAKRLIEQEKHEAEMLLLKLQQQNQLQQKKQALIENKIILSISTGDTTYFDKNNKKHSSVFSPSTNPYLVLLFLCQNPGKKYYAKDIVEHLKKPRQGGEDSTDDRRVRDTINTVREKLGLSKEDDIFIVDNGQFGIRHSIELQA